MTPVASTSSTPESCGTETSVLQNMVVCSDMENENETIDETHVRTTAILSDEVDVKHWKIVSSGVNQHGRYQSFA